MTSSAEDLQHASLDPHSPYGRALAWVLSAALFVNPLGTATAQVVVASGSTTVGKAPNGVPVVNIAAPNARGVSHNRYTDYNVGSQGLILNNATSAVQNTQLAGHIIGNPNLNGSAANLILNEVTGGRPSMLAGYTEIAGQAARLVVANPWGITCNGCGFINTPQVTLTTGTPRIEDGRLAAFRVEGGEILIEGAGLNASNIDQFDLVTRSARINADLYARRLNVVAGRNEVAADSLAATALGADGSQPLFAIDSAALGGMYANSIVLVGTEAGVGVRLAGDLAASAGDIRIDAAGHLSLARSAASGAIAGAAKSIELTGTTYARGSLDMAALDGLAVSADLASGGDLALSAQRIDNGATIEAGVLSDDVTNAGARLQVNASEFANAARVISHGALDMETDLVDNRSGSIVAAGPVTLATHTLDNHGGTLASEQALALTATGEVSNGGGVLLAGAGVLSINATALGNQAGTLGANAIELTLSGTLDNQDGLLESETTFDVVAGTIANTDGRLRALGTSGTSRIEVADNFGNDGLVEAGGMFEVGIAGAYRGSGQLLSGADMAVQAGELSVEAGAEAAIRSAGELSIETAALANHGHVTAGGALALIAGSVDNRGTLGSVQTVELAADSVRNEDGLIFSGSDMLLASDDVLNLRGDLLSLGRLTLVGADGLSPALRLRNLSGTIESSGEMALWADEIENARETFDIDTYKYAARLVYTGCTDCSGSKENALFRLDEIDRTEATNVAPSAFLLAGGDMSLVSTRLDNRYSVIATGGNLAIDTGIFNNLGAQTGDVSYSRNLVSHRMHSLSDMFDSANSFNARHWSVSSAPHKIGGDINGFLSAYIWSASNPSAPTLTTGELYSATIQAAGTVDVAADTTLASGEIRPGYLYVGGGTIPGSDSSITTPVSISPQLPPDTLQQAVDPLGLPGFQLPDDSNGLFARAPAGHPYLIETNPAFAGLANFLNSGYLLTALGYDPDAAQRRLGDGLFEQRLIRDAVLARTGQRFLAGLSSDEAMYRHLMDNALASKEALNLSVGVSLTAEQVAALTHDIVWLEERIVAGEPVLVPVLYLAQAEGRLAPGGALIQGEDLRLIAGGALINQGTLRASRTLVAYADTVFYQGLVDAGGSLAVIAQDSIVNTSGILRGNEVSLTAVDGDVVNNRAVTVHDSVRDSRYAHHQEFVDSAGRIEAGGSLQIAAGRDLVNLGSAIDAGADAALQAGRNLVIGAQAETDTTAREEGRASARWAQTTQHGSDISVGGSLTAVAGQDMAIVASKVSAAEDIALYAGRDLTVAAAAEAKEREFHRRGGGKKIDLVDSTVRQKSAELAAGGSLTLGAGQDLTMVASSASAGREAYLYAGRELALLAAENSDYYLYDKQKKGSWGSRKTRRDEVTTVTQIGSSVTAEGDVTLASGADQRYQVASLASGADLTLDAGGDIRFEAVKDLQQESHEKSSSSWAWNSAKGKGSTDEKVRLSTLTADGELAIKAAGKIRIDVPEVNAKTVAQTIDALVEAEPQLAWLKEMEARGDIDWQRVKEVHDSFKYSHSGMGQVLGIVVAIVVTVATWGAGSAISATVGNAYGAAAGAAAQAAFHSMASTVVVSAINNKGDPGKTLKAAFSEDALKGYVTAAATAALTTGLVDEYFRDTGSANTAGATPPNSPAVNMTTSSGVQASTGAAPSFDLNTWGGVGKFAAYQGSRAVVSSAVDTAINGGSFQDKLAASLTAAAVHTVSAAAFNQMGNLGMENGSIEKVAVKALVGGLISQAATGDFATGALAAGANEALVKHLAGLVDHDPQLLGMASQLVGAVAAGVSGGDAQLAADIANYDTQYNYLNHKRPELLRLSEKERYDKASVACSAGDAGACRIRDELMLDSQQRDRELAVACATDQALCGMLIREAREMGNLVFGQAGQLVWANSPDSGFALNLATIGPVPQNPAYGNTFHYEQAGSLSEGLLLTGIGGATAYMGSTPTLGRLVAGAGLGGGFDAAGQYVQRGEIRPMQTLVAGLSGAAGLPLAARGGLWIPVTGAAVAATNTSFNNFYYGEDTNSYLAAGLGAAFSVVAPPIGQAVSGATNRLLGNPMMYIPAAGPVQSMQFYRNADFWAAVPGQAGSAVANTVGSLPVFIPLDNGKVGGQP